MNNPIVSIREADAFDSLTSQCPVCLIPNAEHPDCINCGHAFNSDDDGLDDERTLEGSDFDDAVYHGRLDCTDSEPTDTAGIQSANVSALPWATLSSEAA